jgi:hypothetical protein
MEHRRAPRQRCHLFHLFYQVQIRLGFFAHLSLLFSLFFAAKQQPLRHLVRPPGARIGAFPKFNDTRTLWQF